VQPPGIAGISLSGTNLVLNGTAGLSGRTYFVLMGTNLTEPFNQWTPVATNVPGADGNFSITRNQRSKSECSAAILSSSAGSDPKREPNDRFRSCAGY